MVIKVRANSRWGDVELRCGEGCELVVAGVTVLRSDAFGNIQFLVPDHCDVIDIAHMMARKIVMMNVPEWVWDRVRAISGAWVYMLHWCLERNERE